MVIITSCCRDKDPAEGRIMALERYLSPRIKAASEVAVTLEVPFRILSGLYGLLEPGHPIPDYDHLLVADEVEEHAVLLQEQMQDDPFTRVAFVTRTLAVDPGGGPYREALRRACTRAQLDFHLVEFESEFLEAEWLEPRIRKLLAEPGDGSK